MNKNILFSDIGIDSIGLFAPRHFELYKNGFARITPDLRKGHLLECEIRRVKTKKD